jgi:uncharacterized protein YjiS (DUF1127 family)
MKTAANKHAPAIVWPLTWPRLSRDGFVAWLVHLDAVHRQRHDLAQLDDHLLRDIGVTRAEVERELARPQAW